MFSRRRRNLGAATLTTAVAAALVAGLTVPASSAAGAALPEDRGTAASADGPEQRSPGGRGKAAGVRWVTLVTGDRVGVDAGGRAVVIDRAKGREHMPFQTFTRDGSTFTVPLDARALIADGRLDQRLFNITELSGAESRRAYRKGLRVIVSYEGRAAATARQGLRAEGEVRVNRSLPSINADAVTVSERDAGALWAALTRTTSARTVAVSGVERIWLDGVRTPNLDKSVARIGAPKAWAAGHDGTGVTIAVLDTGVDRTHPDLRTRVVGEKNFTDSPDTRDRFGHGTHVASIAAGTGAKSGGRHKGVAPGAGILNAKVLGDTGEGFDSVIVAGIDWAVAQGADIVNMSLGGTDAPGIDPVEALVNEMSAKKGVLFAVSAGNDGPGAGTISSPGSADAALTVGAVDDADRMADFSSRGPRVTGGVIKPDVTAPGVDTTAAAAAGIAPELPGDPAGYVSYSGTSMAAPHVAGAAALLKQRHPRWKGSELKAALASTAEDTGHTVFEQGTGRIALDRAVRQNVVTESSSIVFTKQAWPHRDDAPETRKITYRNTGGEDITLDVKVTGTGPQGKPAPAGFFTANTAKVTVPAGGSADVGLTVNTRIGGDSNGHYTATVVATGGGRSVRTVAAVEREVESYDLTVKHIGRDGKPSGTFNSSLFSAVDGTETHLDPGKATVRLRLPKGDYVLDSTHTVDQRDVRKGLDHLIQPKLVLDRDTTVLADARKAEPVTVTMPDARAKLTRMKFSYDKNSSGIGRSGGMDHTFLENVRTAHLGPEVTDGSYRESWAGQWTAGGTTEYRTAFGGTAGKFSTGHVKNLRAADFAAVKVNAGASAKNKEGRVLTVIDVGGIVNSFESGRVPLPAVRTLHLASSAKAAWSLSLAQYSKGVDDSFEDETATQVPERRYRAGTSTTETLNAGVHTPLVNKESGVFRTGNDIVGNVELLADSQGNTVRSPFLSAKTTLHRGTRKIGENDDPLQGGTPFTVGAGDAEYTLATTVKGDRTLARVATRIDAGWTFRSKKPAGDARARLPISSVRFAAKPAPDSTAPAGRKMTIPVTVEGAAAGTGLKSLAVSVSHDGRTWRKVTVTNGRITVTNPAKGKGISFRAQITDKKNNKSVITVHDAYFGK
ncbi:S8 family serine peptidase [Streptomyces sp. CAU 1734]|uniref:S8 family peptidase n=1 Tax=Streptomyces sp. CAU 1734 TaxID=3140360 RepID=UPI00326105EE